MPVLQKSLSQCFKNSDLWIRWWTYPFVIPALRRLRQGGCEGRQSGIHSQDPDSKPKPNELAFQCLLLSSGPQGWVSVLQCTPGLDSLELIIHKLLVFHIHIYHPWGHADTRVSLCSLLPWSQEGLRVTNFKCRQADWAPLAYYLPSPHPGCRWGSPNTNQQYSIIKGHSWNWLACLGPQNRVAFQSKKWGLKTRGVKDIPNQGWQSETPWSVAESTWKGQRGGRRVSTGDGGSSNKLWRTELANTGRLPPPSSFIPFISPSLLDGATQSMTSLSISVVLLHVNPLEMPLQTNPMWALQSHRHL